MIARTLIMIALAWVLTTLALEARAQPITAKWVVTELNPAQRYLYALGVIEGLAYSRYLRDRPSRRGTDCITDWFQREIKTTFWSELHTLIRKKPDQPMSVLVYIMSISRCGK